MNNEQRKVLLHQMDEVLGYSLEKDGAHETICSIQPDTMHTWLLLSILEQLKSIAESLDAIAARGE